MTIVFQASSESHTGTAGAASVASFTWNHAFGSTSKGLAVFVYGFNGATDIITSVTAGGIDVPLIGSVAASFAADATTEPGFIEVYFLGSGLPTTTSAIVVNRTNNATVTYANAISVSAATAETFITGLGEFNDNQSITSVNIDDGGNVGNSLRMMGFYTGAAAPPTANSATTVGGTGLNIDIGAYGAGTYREITAGSGSRPIGFSATHNDDTAAIYFAVSEVTYNLTELDCIQDATSGTGVVDIISNDINLTSADVSQANSSENTLIDQTHLIDIANVSQQNISTDSIILQTHVIIQSNSSQNAISGVNSIDQTHIILQSNSSQNNTSNTGFINQVHVIVQSNSSQNSASSTGVIDQTHIIVQSNSNQTNLSSTGTITLDLPVELVASNVAQSNNSSDQIISQIQILVGSNSTVQSYIASVNNIGLLYDVIEVTITFEIPLQISASNQLNASQSVAITVDSAEINLATGTDSQNNLSESILITQIHELLKLDSLQINFATSNSISQSHVLVGSTVQLLNKNFVGEPVGILSTPWVQAGDGNVQVLANGNIRGANRSIAWYSGLVYTPNQYAEITLKTIDLNASQNSGIALRIQTGFPGFERGYIFKTGNAGAEYTITKYNELSFNIILATSTVIPVIGDVLRFEVIGNLLTAYVNNVQILQITDNSYSSGVPAIYFNSSNSELNDFVAGNLGEANVNSQFTTSDLITQTHTLLTENNTQNSTTTTNQITQIHELLKLDSLQTNSATSDLIIQTHILLTENNTQNTSSSSEAISITGDIVLTASNVSQAASSNTGNISQSHNITQSNLTQLNTSNTGVISQIQVLTQANSNQINNSTANSIVQSQILIVSNVSQLSSTTANSITQSHVLVQANSNQTNTSQNILITQSHVLSASNVIDSKLSSINSISQIHILTGANSSQSAISPTGLISSIGGLLPANSLQLNTSTTNAITQIHALVGTSSTVSNTSNLVSITLTQNLIHVNSSQNNFSTSNSISQTHLLSKQDSSQLNNSSLSLVTQIHSIISSNLNQTNNSSVNNISLIFNLNSLNAIQNSFSSIDVISQIHQLNQISDFQDNYSQSVAVLFPLFSNINNQFNISNGEQIIQTGYWIRKVNRIRKLPKYLIDPHSVRNVL